MKVLSYLGCSWHASVAELHSVLARTQTHANLRSKGPTVGLEVACHFENVEVCIMCERIRVRTSLSHLDVCAAFRGSSPRFGQGAVCLGSFAVVNETSGRRSRDHWRDWSVLVSPVLNFESQTRSSSLRDKIEKVMAIPPVTLGRLNIDLSSISPGSLPSTMTEDVERHRACLLYTSPSPRDGLLSRMPSSA